MAVCNHEGLARDPRAVRFAVAMKMFFSYSTRDADLVRAVVSHLGRPFVTIDYLAFETGDDLIAAIEKAIHEASIFVLFVSRNALESDWVRAETAAARYEYALGRLARVLVYLTDDSLRSTHLPPWLTRLKYSYLHASRPIARELRHIVDDEIRTRRASFFVDRVRETAIIQDALAQPDGAASPKILALSGLDGIGRQTLLARVARDFLTIPRTLRIDIESGDAIQDLAAKLADLLGGYVTPESALSEIAKIRDLDDAAAQDRAVSLLTRTVSLHEIAVLYDRGGLLDNYGKLVVFVHSLLSALEAHPDVYVALITNRRLAVPERGAEVQYPPFASVEVRPLASDDVKRLVTLVARDARVALTRADVETLADQVRGYPPAVYFALELMKSYGPTLVLQERNRIITFRTNPFVQYLRSLDPTAMERSILRMLASNSPLPLEVLTSVIRDDEKRLPTALARLIDVSLVLPDDSGWYRISDPVVDAVEAEIGVSSAAEHGALADSLGRYLRNPTDDGAFLALTRVRFRALVLSGRDHDARAIQALAADWIQLAERFYHRQDYVGAIRAAESALEARGDNADALMWLARGMIKEERYEEATNAIARLRRLGLIKETLYYEGFLARNRGDLRGAAEKFQRALGAGYRGVAIQRELALCYFGLGNIREADKYLAGALDSQPDNRYLIDLSVQLATTKGDADVARDLLDRLEQVDRPGRASHRRSRVEDAFGNREGAYRAAEEAVRQFHDMARPPFAVLANFALMAIKTGRDDDADKVLLRLDREYPRTHHDIRVGLRCRAAIARGEYDTALTLWEALEVKGKPVHRGLRRDAIRGKLQGTVVPDAERMPLEAELDELRRRLARTDPRELEYF